MTDEPTPPIPPAEPTVVSAIVAIFFFGGAAGVAASIFAGDISNPGDWIERNPHVFGTIVGAVVVHILSITVLVYNTSNRAVSRAIRSVAAPDPDPPANP